MTPAKRRPGAGGIRRTEYGSGLRVVTESMPEMRSIALGVWVDVGSRDERPEIAGTSHFLEHLLFKGTKRRSARDIAEAFDAVGGDLNAFSAKEYTCYYCRVLDRDLPMAVDFMADMIQHSTIATSDVETERNVILEEIAMRDDDPGDLIHDLFAETLWQGHPLGRPVLGTRETIGSVSRDRVKRFYTGRYKAPRFVVAAAGNLEHDALCALLEEHMDTGKRRSESSAPRVRGGGDVPRPSGATLVHKRKTEQAHLCLGTGAYSRRDPDRFAFGVVNTALGGGMSSRLFQEVREKRALAYAVGSYHTSFAETGFFCAYAGTTPTRVHETLDVMRGEIERLAEKGLPSDELERAKGHMKGSLVLSLEDTPGRMSRIGKSEIGHGEILTVDELLERIDAVTEDDAARVAEQVLSGPLTLAVVGPFKSGEFRSSGG
ncbi:MAG TPA: pitrilysin family protein [Actinomycetota bacterium]|nr:pitrilysin family protein [Actinomycetota bacterium]